MQSNYDAVHRTASTYIEHTLANAKKDFVVRMWRVHTATMHKNPKLTFVRLVCAVAATAGAATAVYVISFCFVSFRNDAKYRYIFAVILYAPAAVPNYVRYIRRSIRFDLMGAHASMCRPFSVYLPLIRTFIYSV